MSSSTHSSWHQDLINLGDIQLICTDLDGTLLDGTYKVPSRTVKSVIHLASLGIPIVLITGKRPIDTRKILNQLPGAGPLAVSSNGAIIIERDSDQLYKSLALSEADVRQIFKIAKDVAGVIKLGFSTESVDDLQLDAEMFYILNSFMPVQQPFELDLDVSLNVQEYTTKVMLGHRDHLQIYPNIVAALNTLGFAATIAGPGTWVEITHAEANKGTGVKAICNLLGVAYENTLIFGDSHNDLPMFELPVKKAAVANATEEIKALADIIVPSNIEEGVSQALDVLVAHKRNN